MHTTKLPSGARAHHNGDYSGEVFLVVSGKNLDIGHNPDGSVTHNVGAGFTLVEVSIPMDDLIAIVGNWIVQQRVNALESAISDPKKFKKLLAGL